MGAAVRMELMYDDLSDEELVELVKNGDGDAFCALKTKFSKFICFNSRFYVKNGCYDEDDLAQQALIALYRAALSFKADYGSRFFSYASEAIRRTVKTYVFRATKKKIALDEHLRREYLENGDWNERVCSVAEDPERYVVVRDVFERLKGVMDANLSKTEREAVVLLAKGLSYSQIAKALNRDLKSVDNALQRARKKLSMFMNVDECLFAAQRGR